MTNLLTSSNNENIDATTKIGEVVNLLAVDTAKLQQVSQHIFMLWSGPLQMTLSIIFLFQQIGLATLVCHLLLY
jgi:ATP-binding cassette subfamily C (CFTR/MRP) protein 1